MARWGLLLALLGLAIATGVIVWSGWAQVVAALAQSGWGIAVLSAFHVVAILVSATGWWLLVASKRSPSLPAFFYFMWVRAAINNLMPVARIGGEVAVIRLMTARGMRRNSAIAATVVELTLSVLAVFVFVTLGAVLLALHVGGGDIARRLGWALLLALPVLAALVLVQRIGFFTLLSRIFNLMFRDKWASMVGSASRLDRTVHGIYRRKARIAACGLLQFVNWSMGSIETWMALGFLGHPLPLSESLMLEALVLGSASLGFAIPGALGVQEAGFLVFGGILGLPPEISAALAVLRRCRDLLIYVPGLVAWQAHEGKRLLRS